MSPAEPQLDDDWLAALTRIVQAMGSDNFADELLAFLNMVTPVDSCVVFTHAPEAGTGHLFTHGRMDEDLAESLARDYVERFHTEDPNFPALSTPATGEHLSPLALDADYDPAYRNYFFDRVGLVDKAAAIGRLEVGSVYCNFYRMSGSGRYSPGERLRLDQVLPIVTSLIGRHYEFVRARHPEDEKHSTRSLVHNVISTKTETFEVLTERERQVCSRILLGYTSVGIGLDLDIAPSSVATYRRRAYEKLGISSQNELFALCLAATERL